MRCSMTESWTYDSLMIGAGRRTIEEDAQCSRRYVGDLLLNPVALSALLILVVNDHIAKQRLDNAVTGKLSDFAGLVLFPLVVVTVAEATRWVFVRSHWPLTTRWLSAAVAGTGLAFALTKTWAPMGSIYRLLYSTAQWPLRTIADAVAPGASSSSSSIQLVRDPTDLVALVALVIAWLAGRRVMKRAISPRRRPMDGD